MEPITLDETDKKLLDLHHREGLGVRRCAAELGIDPSTASRRLRKLEGVELDEAGEPIPPEPPKPREPRPSDLYEILKPYGPPDEFARRGLFVGQRVTRGLLHQCRLPASAMVAQRCLRPIDAPEREPDSFETYVGRLLDKLPKPQDRATAAVKIMRREFDKQRHGIGDAPESDSAFLQPLLDSFDPAELPPAVSVDAVLRGPERVQQHGLEWLEAVQPDTDQLDCLWTAFNRDDAPDRDAAERVRTIALQKLAAAPLDALAFVLLNRIMVADRSTKLRLRAAEALLAQQREG